MNHTLVITGASGSIGSAVASLAREMSYDLVLADLPGEGLDQLAADFPSARVVAVDVTQAADLGRLAQEAVQAFGRPVQKLVAAAGILGPNMPLCEMPEEVFDRIMQINLKGSWLTTKAFLPQMQAARGGAIVLLSSSAGLQGSRDLGAYSASKGGVTLLGKSLALAHAADGIRVNCVCPGTIESRMSTQSIGFAQGELAQAERRRKLEAAHPLGRLGQPSEVAHAILHLLDDRAGFTTGVALPIDGGRLA